MSHGLGNMQEWLVTMLFYYPRGKTLGALHREYLKKTADEESSAEDRARSVRNSMTRALRGLEKLGKVKRGEDGLWLSTDPILDAIPYDERKDTAHHEAGHAVIGLAMQLPIAFACITPGSRQQAGYVSEAHTAGPVGYVYKKHGKSTRLDTESQTAALDAFGNPPLKRECSPEEHHGEVIMCIAGGMAEAKLRGDIKNWRVFASRVDKSIARDHRAKLGDAAKSWGEYEQETAALINKHWPKVEAVAARLMKVDFVGAGEIDAICCRVVRRQHLESEFKGNA